MIQLTIWKIQSEKITFNFLLNIARLLQSVIAVGNEFHIVTDSYKKDCCPVTDLYPGMSNLFLFLVFWSCTVVLVTKQEQIYPGASH